ncbi:hypothetical protein Leryth_019601 [Lithospermum erythrorhizon]|nr:hypothetical protein Leryth_019601 [Lithospermum erythrorhizon]
MDSGIWNARLAAAKRQLHPSSGNNNHHLNSHFFSCLDQLNIDYIDLEEEGDHHFPCPYCYEEFDIASLCSHLEEEHAYESKITLCSNYSILILEILVLHTKYFSIHVMLMFCPLQRRHRSRRDTVPRTQALSVLRRDLREAHRQMLLGGNRSRTINESTSSVATHPLLSSLVEDFPSFEVEDISKSIESTVEDSISTSTPSQHVWRSRFDPSLSHEERQRRIRQAAGRAEFVQDLFLSSLLAE